MSWLMSRIGSDYARDMQINKMDSTGFQNNVKNFNDLLDAISAEQRRKDKHPLDMAFEQARIDNANLTNADAANELFKTITSDKQYYDKNGNFYNFDSMVNSANQGKATANKLFEDARQAKFNNDTIERIYGDFRKKWGKDAGYFQLDAETQRLQNLLNPSNSTSIDSYNTSTTLPNENPTNDIVSALDNVVQSNQFQITPSIEEQEKQKNIQMLNNLLSGNPEEQSQAQKDFKDYLDNYEYGRKKTLGNPNTTFTHNDLLQKINDLSSPEVDNLDITSIYNALDPNQPYNAGVFDGLPDKNYNNLNEIITGLNKVRIDDLNKNYINPNGLYNGVDTKASNDDYVALTTDQGNIVTKLGDYKKLIGIDKIADDVMYGKTIKGFIPESMIKDGSYKNIPFLKDNNYKLINQDGSLEYLNKDISNVPEADKYQSNINTIKKSIAVMNEFNSKNVKDDPNIKEPLLMQNKARINNSYWLLQNEYGTKDYDNAFADAISTNMESQGRLIGLNMALSEREQAIIEHDPELKKLFRTFITTDFGSKSYKQTKEDILAKLDTDANNKMFKSNIAVLLDYMGDTGLAYRNFIKDEYKITDINKLRNTSKFQQFSELNPRVGYGIYSGKVEHSQNKNGTFNTDYDLSKVKDFNGVSLDIFNNPEMLGKFYNSRNGTYEQMIRDEQANNERKKALKESYPERGIRDSVAYTIRQNGNKLAEKLKRNEGKPEDTSTYQVKEYPNKAYSMSFNRIESDYLQPERDQANRIIQKYKIPKLPRLKSNRYKILYKKDLTKLVPEQYYNENKQKLKSVFPNYESYAVFMLQYGQTDK